MIVVARETGCGGKHTGGVLNTDDTAVPGAIRQTEKFPVLGKHSSFLVHPLTSAFCTEELDVI